MSNRLGGFIAGQNIDASIGTFTAVTSPTFTFGSTAGTPAVGQAVQFTTTGTLPTGLSTGTTYYVISTSTNTCQFSTTLGGSAVTFTNSSGSGVHTAVTQRAFNPYAGAPDTVEYLVVAGGAGGQGARFNAPAYRGGGGGGAGGLLTAAGFNVATGTALTITVGAGGTGATAGNDVGTIGSNSVFSSITTIGGQAWGYTGVPGGSGAGGSQNSGVAETGGAGTAGQGFNGGNGSSDGQAGGGGGGAGSVGTIGISGTAGGNGGAGMCSTITGQRVFYAGGGGGNVYSVGTAGLGGGGGGGNASNTSLGTAGTSNTGGGGSAGYSAGMAGGSGIVIVRYPQVNSAPALVTGSPQVSYSDGYQIYTWTSSGSIIF